jgi:hypothetical protein
MKTRLLISTLQITPHLFFSVYFHWSILGNSSRNGYSSAMSPLDTPQLNPQPNCRVAPTVFKITPPLHGPRRKQSLSIVEMCLLRYCIATVAARTTQKTHPPYCWGVFTVGTCLQRWYVDIKPSEDGQLTETCKGSKYIQLNHTGRC